jgi:hypothetical protein
MASRTPKSPEAAAATSAKPRKTRAAATAPEAVPVGGKTAKAPKPAAKAAGTPAEAKAAILKLKDLVDSVAEATGAKKPEVKATVEATLSALGSALASGRSLAVPPLGKLRVVKTRGAALTLKLRLADGAKAAELGLAADGEDG